VPVISTDLYPSILEMIGAPARPDQHADGVGLAPLLRGATALGREALYWHFPHYSNHGLQSPAGAIRWRDWKLIEYFENGVVQLFNLRDDPGEQQDRAQDQPGTAAKLQSLLHEWQTRVGARMPGTKP
jgi:arylsulfatase A-like enzyme